MIGNSQQIIQWLFQQNDLTKKYEIKEHRQRRSLNQNAYCWELIGKIADDRRLSKEEVYMSMLRDYGQSQIISVRADIDINGYFKYFGKQTENNIYGTKPRGGISCAFVYLKSEKNSRNGYCAEKQKL